MKGRLIISMLLFVFGSGAAAQGLYPGAIDHTFSSGWRNDYNSQTLESFLVLLPDGSILYARDGLLGKISRTGLADHSFKSPPGFFISKGVVDQSGKIILASGNRQYATNLIWIEPSGEVIKQVELLDESAPHPVLAIQPDGKIIVWSSRGIRRLFPDGSRDPTFICETAPFSQTGYPPKRILIQPDGAIILIGGFVDWDRLPRKGIARFLSNGTFDRSYAPGVYLAGPNYIYPQDATLTPVGGLLVVGNFSTAFGEIANGITLVSTNGFKDSGFRFNGSFLESTSMSVAIAKSGDEIFFGGSYFFCRLSATGVVKNQYNINVGDIWTRPDGDVITSLLSDRVYVYRLRQDGSLDPSYYPLVSGVERILSGPASSIWVYLHRPDPNPDRSADHCGFSAIPETGTLSVSYGSCGDLPYCFQGTNLVMVGSRDWFTRYIYRLSNGQIDPTFQHYVLPPHTTVNTIVTTAEGRLLVGILSNSTTNRCLLRLNKDGTLDTNFVANVRGPVNSIRLLADGQILVAGGSQGDDSVFAILNHDGTTDPSFAPPQLIARSTPSFPPVRDEYAQIFDAEQLPSGDILAVGNFYRCGSSLRGGAALFNRQGVLLPGWFQPHWEFSHSIAVDNDGKVLLASSGNPFLSRSGRIERFLSDGTRDPTFTPATLNGGAKKLMLDSTGRIVASGPFTEVNGLSAVGIVRLFSHIAAPVLTLSQNEHNVIAVAHGTPSSSCVLESSSNLLHWSPLATNFAFSGTEEFVLPITQSNLFLRTILK